MMLSATLNRYLAQSFLRNFIAMLGVLMGIVYLFDTLELLRRASHQPGIPLPVVLKLGILKLPEVGQMILPFAVLFSAMFSFWQMNRRSELIVMRSAGFSVWQFLAPVFSVAVLMAIVYLSLLNPIGAAMLSRYEVLENRLFSHKTSAVTLLKGGLWLRQDLEDGHIILHADKIDTPDWILRDVMALYFDNEDRFLRRLDAPDARLAQGQWIFQNVTSNQPGHAAEALDSFSLPTDLTSRQIEESFASPTAISFWKLPGFIQAMQQTGFDATPLRIYFQTLLAQPLLFVAMILLAAAVSLRPPRFRGVFIMVILGTLCGFCVFFAASFMQALGSSHQIPVLAASWATPVIATLIGIAVILNFEDG